MNCPKCKEGEVKEQVTLKGFIFKKKRVVTFCPLCDFKNEHIFDLSKEDTEIENLNRLNTEKKTTINYNTKREEIK
jgi:hypothetical protein